ncbi:hypothetical protein BT69DRAFT_1348665 [Atractiella rhizophila]|nr:hypothetical protein BT69DRAFT_1359001 [Atractiella rhizophila]KAH8925579.1 hypothetical protein BT69DRAFT_1348665 [Atractiella rhizophila]
MVYERLVKNHIQSLSSPLVLPDEASKEEKKAVDVLNKDFAKDLKGRFTSAAIAQFCDQLDQLDKELPPEANVDGIFVDVNGRVNIGASKVALKAAKGGGELVELGRKKEELEEQIAHYEALLQKLRDMKKVEVVDEEEGRKGTRKKNKS